MTYSDVLSYAVNFLELIAAVFALIHYPKYVQSTERYFLHFLWLTFFIDSVVGVFFSIFFEFDNIWVYYAYTGFSFSFYCWWYYKVLLKSLHKILSSVFFIIFLIAFYTGIFYLNMHKYIFVIGALLVLILTCLHLHQLSNSDYTLKIKYKLSFWISTALVLFNIGMFPLILLSNYFNVRMDNVVFTNILFFLNLVLYTCYIIGFIWTKQKYNHF